MRDDDNGDGIGKIERAEMGSDEDRVPEGVNVEDIVTDSDSGIVLRRPWACIAELRGSAGSVGRRKLVSKEWPARSGSAMLCTDSEARSIELSYERPVSGTHCARSHKEAALVPLLLLEERWVGVPAK